ncbi:hypothetical protein K504DRAFT_472204 [Pleomassaria siparia CBS 279.74]|uniref:HTH APSES-type domain-containing protein n=1 Tax=Pleomassaria siparia CBS 279.74 TaxID=1314801 RepID=A0A6G1JUX3_9PLEO|nr:hypothetical protein K504DRAFT_472204 [Pleomassaria siparia CBS 279.74]
MKIQSLLNPFCGEQHGYRSSESPTPAVISHSQVPCTSAPKRQKVPKDAAIFTDGSKINGAINFPPYEYADDEELAMQHRNFNIYPIGEILTKGARHIPYNSDKKDFMVKTGREAFEVFQYTFKVPGDERDYPVLWDYNIGLVRITPFFKCCNYSKTTPAKVLNLNQGLRDICYSITGGALAAQGYWMPYAAAKAVAATFCYNIRYALTPVFGKDFLTMCIHGKDPSYAKFLIDPAIVRECTAQTNRWKEEGKAFKPAEMEPPSVISTPRSQFACPPWGFKGMKQQQRRAKPADIESGYGTDTDQSDKYICSPQFSPQISPRSQLQAWTPVNRSQSPVSSIEFKTPSFSPVMTSNPILPNPCLSSVPGVFEDHHLRTKRTHSKVAYGIEEDEIPRPSTSTSAPADEEDNGSYSENDCGDGIHTKKELDAAEIILALSAADKSLPPTKRTRRGSKY